MDAIRKQATKLREQVARQQQAVLRRLGTLSNDTEMVDEDELLCHQQLQNLYNSTRAAKHFQRNIVRGVEGFISVSSKQMEIVRKLAEDFCKYGDANQTIHSALARASTYFGISHNSIEKERDALLKILVDQVCEPLRAQINGAPLEDARHLAHRYDKLRQDVEAQVAEVLRRRLKSRGPSISEESSIKLQSAEARLAELKSSIMALGREATAAMLSVEEQQQKMTFHTLLTMVDAERSYHQHALVILEKLHAEMTLEKQPQEFSPSASMKIQKDVFEWLGHQDNKSNGRSDNHGHLNKDDSFQPKNQDDSFQQKGQNDSFRQKDKVDNFQQENQDDTFFIAKVIHQFDAQADGELSLSVDDFVVVRQVAPNGWSEGECNGKAGWFPSAYIQRQEKAPATKIM
ncbi:SH3 domain-containing protein 1 [Morus notabilis]|uniref:SH3 domain-containing protein 1 n=1 Tax=Morus notabilis TaxID=981085 RepID=UPI000CECED75|nr:SH3 domain-containing protein 1 [Morus notabilis]